MGVAAGAAGIVKCGGVFHTVRAFRQANLFQNIPDSDDFPSDGLCQFFPTAGTSCNYHRIAELGKFCQQKLSRAFLHLIAPRPVADCPAAAEHQRHTAFQSLTQIEICRFYRRRRDG